MRETTRASYHRQFNGARTLVARLTPKPVAYVLLRPRKYGPLLRALDVPPNSLAAYITVWMTLLRRGRETRLWATPRSLSTRWNAVLGAVRGASRDRVETNQESLRERAAHTPLAEWRAAEERMRASASPEHLLVAFHALATPLRGGDLANVRIVPRVTGAEAHAETHADASDASDASEAEGGDRLDLARRRLFVCSHKTRATHPVLKRALSPALLEAVERSLVRSPRTRLFERADGAAWTRAGFIAWKQGVFLRVFGRPASTNGLRHAFISAIDRNATSVAERREVAHAMGHSPGEQERYVRLAPIVAR